jgi:hypothetical protein
VRKKNSIGKEKEINIVEWKEGRQRRKGRNFSAWKEEQYTSC